jgi:hypothetical protein
VKASIRSRLPRNYLFARLNRRQVRTRLKPWWRRHRCSCCEPWRLESDWYRPLTTRRNFGLRIYAREWLHMLAPLEPRLRGPLAEDEEIPDRFAAGIELDVACEEPCVLLDLLDRFGYRAERLTGLSGVVFSIDALVPIEVALRGVGVDEEIHPGEPACDDEQLEELMRTWYEQNFEPFRT